MARIQRSALHSTAYTYFEAVARLGSVRKAAAELFVVPSAVSHQIATLEEELGISLFSRLPKGLQLSSAGEMLLYHGRRGASELERGRSLVTSLRGLQSGSTSLATVEGVAVGPVSQALTAFWTRWPAVRVGVTIGSSARAFDAVDSGEAELGLSYAKPDSPKVTVLAQAELPVGAVFRSDHPLAKSKSLNVRELMDAGLPLLLADRSIEIRQMMEHAIGKDALRLLPRLDTNSVMVMSQLAKTGAGVAVKTRIGIEQELARGELVFVPLRELAAAKQRLLLFFRQDTRLTPTAAALAETLTAMVLALDS